MVQRNGRNGCRFRGIDDIGGVKPSAQPYFQYHNVAVSPGKPEQGHGSDKLKFGNGLATGFHLIGCGGNGLHLFNQFFFGNHLAVNLEPLPEFQHIGRSIQSGAVSGGFQRTGNQGTGSPFSIRARHMDKFQLLLGIPQLFQQRGNPFQSGLDAKTETAVDLLHGLFIGHFQYLHQKKRAD